MFSGWTAARFSACFCSSCFGQGHHGKSVLHPSILHFGILTPWLYIELTLFSRHFYLIFLFSILFLFFHLIHPFSALLVSCKISNDLTFDLRDVLLLGYRISLLPSLSLNLNSRLPYTFATRCGTVYCYTSAFTIAVVSSYICT